jgi:hypothetical protein
MTLSISTSRVARFTGMNHHAQHVFLLLKKKKIVVWDRHRWLMSIILATWEAEIRRLEVRGQPGQIV